MSYLQWHGRTWPITTDAADLIVHIPARDCPAAPIEWDLSLDHFVHNQEPGPNGKRVLSAALQLSFSHLGLRPRTWHGLAGQHIRADARWYEQTTEFGAHGHMPIDRFEATCWVSPKCDHTPPLGPVGQHAWRAVDFEIRFGQRDGLVFPCEIDAWVIPREEFDRDEPETPEELAVFGQGPPNLRILTRAVFTSGTIQMPRCGDDPWPQSRHEILAALGPLEFARHEVTWSVCARPPPNDLLTRPGWRSSIQFWTTQP